MISFSYTHLISCVKLFFSFIQLLQNENEWVWFRKVGLQVKLIDLSLFQFHIKTISCFYLCRTHFVRLVEATSTHFQRTNRGFSFSILTVAAGGGAAPRDLPVGESQGERVHRADSLQRKLMPALRRKRRWVVLPDLDSPKRAYLVNTKGKEDYWCNSAAKHNSINKWQTWNLTKMKEPIVRLHALHILHT